MNCTGKDDCECENCCEHDFDPDKGYTCLYCGKEGAADIISEMADRLADEWRERE